MTALDKARAAWGDDLPDWVAALAARADTTSQNRAAAEIGYSAATVSYVLTRRYPGDLVKIEEAVRATILAGLVLCPAMGEMPLASCLEWRAASDRPFRALSSLHTTMRRACGACPRKGGKSDV